jgi:hypothetical protein
LTKRDRFGAIFEYSGGALGGLYLPSRLILEKRVGYRAREWTGFAQTASPL